MTETGDDARLLLWARSWVEAGPAMAGRMGLAVSGGGDSTAMLHLMAGVARQCGLALEVVTVDHGLRAEAVDEAAFVARVAADLNLMHTVLVWEHGKITGNLMERARQARYRLIADWARDKGIENVALAHNADDVAEGFLIGLSRAAGLDGLIGMRRRWSEGGVTFHRPFLAATRRDLRDYLLRNGLIWVEDPTNDNDHYTRTKARRALKALQPLGITVDNLHTVVHNLSMAQGVVSEAVRRAAGGVVGEVAGALTFQRQDFLELGPELNRLLWSAMLRWMAGLQHAPRAESLHRLQQALVADRDATLAGCRLRVREGRATLSREARAVGGPVSAGVLWDGRWRVSGLAGDVRALGAVGLRQCPDWRATGLPRQVLEVTPALWHGDRLIAAPSAGFGAATATCTPSFHASLISH